MAVPRQVKKEAEEADRKAKEAIASLQSGNTPPPAAPPAPPTPAAEPPPPATPEPVPAPSPEGSSPAREPAPAEPPAPPAPDGSGAAAPEPGATPAAGEGPEGDGDYRHRFLTLQGIHKADTARSRQEIEKLRDQNLRMEAKLAAMTELMQGRGLPGAGAQAPAQPAAPAAPEPPPKLFGRREEFGEDLASEVDGAALRAADLRVQPLKQDLQAALSSVQEMRDRDFVRELSALRPDWEAITNRAEWAEWLNRRDPLRGVTYGKMLDEASGEYDAERVARLFNAFDADLRAAASGTPQGTQPRVARPDLREHIAPRPVAGQPPTAPAKKVWTSAEVNRVTDDLVRGRIKDPAERKRLQAEIDLAIREGRVRR